MSSIDTAVLLWGLVFSSIGLGYFIYGRRRSLVVYRYAGIALMLYPYFISNSLMMVVMGITLLLLPKILKP